MRGDRDSLSIENFVLAVQFDLPEKSQKDESNDDAEQDDVG